MTHKIIFKNISGNSIIGQFDVNAKISSACSFLSKEIKAPAQFIRLMNPNECKYLDDNLKIIESLSKSKQHENTFIYFILPTEPNDNHLNKTAYLSKDESSKETVYQHIHNLPKSISIFQELSQQPTDYARKIYRQYARNLRLPDDFEQKVDELRQMGFSAEDSRIALRASNFNVEAAANQMINNQNGRNLEDSPLSILESLGTVRNGQLEIDATTIQNFIEDNSDRPEGHLLGLLFSLFRNQRSRDTDDDHNHEPNQPDHDVHGYEEDIEEDATEFNEELSNKLDVLEINCNHATDVPYFNAFNEYIHVYRSAYGPYEDDSLIAIVDLMNDALERGNELPDYILRYLQEMTGNYQEDNELESETVRATIERMINDANLNRSDEEHVFDLDDNIADDINI